MAISAKFSADFADFQTAVAKADVSLKGLETGAGKVGTSLNKMGNALSGTKLIQDAALMEKALQDLAKEGIGLTTAEMQKLGKTATEAAEKMRAMGIAVPPGIQKIADATKNVGTSLDSVKGLLASAAGAFGIAFSVGAVVQFGKSVFDAAGKINDMAAQMGISTDAVQGFQLAAEQSGSTLDAVGSAIGKMNANLAGGDKATVKALKDAGLGFSEIRAMKPEDAFLAISDAIAKIEDPMKQVEIGRRLMGKGFDELLPAMKEGFRETAASASKMSKETIKALDDAGDAWGRLSTKVTIVSGEMIAAAEKGISGMVSGVKNLTSSIGHFQVFAQNVMTMGVGPALALADAWEQAAKGGVKVKDTNLELPKPLQKTAEQMAAAAEAAKKFNDELAKWSGAKATDDMKMLDAVFKALAKSGKLTEDQINAIVKEAIKLQGEGAKLTPLLYEMARVTDALHPSLGLVALNLKNVGDQIEVNATHVDAYAQAIAKLDSMSKSLTVGNLKFGSGADIDIGKPNIAGAMAAIKANADWVQSLGDVTNAFDFLASSSSGSLAAVVRSLGDVTAAIQNVMKIQAEIGKSGGLSGDGKGGSSTAAMVGNIALMATGYGAVAMAAYKAGKAIYNAMNDGRKAVEDFAKASGGFDALRKQMLDLGEAGDQLWIKLTQQTKRGDQNAAAAVIKEIQEALANSPKALAAAAGYQTTAELQAVADKAKATYDYMVSSGQYSAAAIADAFQKSKDAQVDALGDSAKAQQDALDAISAKYKDTIDKIDSEMKSLSDSIAKEAPEEFMGIVEAQERARLEDLKNQKAAQEAMRDAEVEAKKSTFDAILDAGKKTYDQLRELFGRGLDIPYNYVPPGGSGGSGGGPSPTYTPPKGGPGGGDTSVHVYIGNEAVDRHVLRVVKTRLPGELSVSGR